MDTNESEADPPARKRAGGFASALLGDASARDAIATARMDRKFRARQLKRQDNENEREFRARKRSARWDTAKTRLVGFARAAIVVGPITAPMSVAWTGQASFAMTSLGWSFPAGVLYAAAYEMTTVFCAWMYHEARKDGDKGVEYRLATWAFAAGAAAQQWWHYSADWDPTFRAVTFASMTMISLVVWELFARLVHRRKLRRDGKIGQTRPKFGLVRWLRYPRTTFDAWSMSILKGHATLDLAWSEADRLAARRRSAKIARRSVQVENGRRWSRRDRAQVVVDRPEVHPGSAVEAPGSGPDRAQIETGPDGSDIQGPAIEAGSGASGIDGTDQAGPAGGPDDFQPTELERQAVALLVSTGRAINRANCAEAVRELDGGIATKRAADLAKWGRDNNAKGPKAVKAV